jgi:hypothetical protein
MTEEVFVPIERLAAKFCVTIHTVRAWVRQGHIPRSAYVKVGNTYRFSVDRVTAALTSGIMKTPDAEESVSGQEATLQEIAPVQLELDFNLDVNNDA